MSKSVLTSTYLHKILIKPSDGPPNPAFEKHMGEGRIIWEMIAPMILDQYENVIHFLNDWRFTGPKEQLAIVLDDFLCRKLVSEIPKIVERVLKLEPIVTVEDPSDSVHVYFRQAMRCYALGIPLAAVALARACLEQALRERVPLASGLLKLDDLITAAGRFKKLDPAQLQLASDVRRVGNEVMHRGECNDEKAFTTILRVRALVEALYQAVN
jgi:hypothetical protein